MQNKFWSKIVGLFWTLILLMNIFVTLPILIYILIYGVKGLFVFEMIGATDNGFIVNLLPFIFSLNGLLFFSSIFLLGIIVLGIFLGKKRWYKVLLGFSWILSFGAVLMIVIKTYTYLPSFITSIIAGTVLVVWWFTSWYACFWGYKQRKFLPAWLPSVIWIGSVVVAFLLLKYIPDPVLTVDYFAGVGVSEVVVYSYTPWTLDSKEFIFAGGFLLLLWMSRFSLMSVLQTDTPLWTKEKWYRRTLVIGSISCIVVIVGYIVSQKNLFITPEYDIHTYDNILIKSGYNENRWTWNNAYYLQNQWLLHHTGFLQKINQNIFVRQNYDSQSGLVTSGFTSFWQEFSGGFRREFIEISGIVSLPYAMLNPNDAELWIWFPEEKIRERGRLVNSVALSLCAQGECDEWFSYRKDRYQFTSMRLTSGPGIIGTLIAIVGINDSLSGVQQMLPYLSPTQKIQLKSLLIPYDIWYLSKNMLVQEYYFVRKMGIDNIKDYMNVEKVSAPKFVLDLEYTDFLMKQYFANLIQYPQEVERRSSEQQVWLRYNFNGFLILNGLLPRISHIYNRFEWLEKQRRELYNFVQK